MPPKDDDDPKSTKEVVTKKQKQMLNREELDLSLIAEAFGGVVMEKKAVPITGDVDDVERTTPRNKPTPEKKYRGSYKPRVTFGRGGSGSERVTVGQGGKLPNINRPPGVSAAAQAQQDAARDENQYTAMRTKKGYEALARSIGYEPTTVRTTIKPRRPSEPSPTRQSKPSPTRQPVTPYTPTGPGGQGPTTGGSSAQSGAGRGRSLRAARILQQPGGTGGRDAGSIARQRLNQSKQQYTLKNLQRDVVRGLNVASNIPVLGQTPVGRALKIGTTASPFLLGVGAELARVSRDMDLAKVKKRELEALKPIKRGTTISVMNPLTGKVEQLTQAEFEKRTGRKTAVAAPPDTAAAPNVTPPKSGTTISQIFKNPRGNIMTPNAQTPRQTSPIMPGGGTTIKTPERPKRDKKGDFQFQPPGGLNLYLGRRQNPQ